MTPQQQMIVDAFNSTTYVNNRMDVQDTPLYDTVIITAGAPTNILSVLTSALFTNVGPASGKTLALTNMTTQQKLQAPQAFSIFGFRFRWSEDVLLQDLIAILNQFALEFFLGDKCYQRGPLWYYGAGGGVFSGIASLIDTVYVNGVPGREAMHKLAIPIVIENQMNFYGQLQGNQYTMQAAGTGFTFQLVLSGLYARGVQ